MQSGILSYGAYIPRLRLQRKSVVEANAWFNPGLKGQAKGERSMANWDEDAVTMAVEAARDCLTGIDRETIKGVYLASTSFPFDDRQNSGIVAQALDLPSSVATLDVAASQRAGTSGFIAALRAAAGGAGPVLFLAADRRRTKPGSPQEMLYGDGAVALLLGSGKAAINVLAAHTESVDFVDHYRGHGEDFDYGWEERWIRDEGYMKIVPASVAGALKQAKVSAKDIAHFCMPGTISRIAGTVAKRCGLPETAVRDNLHAECGDTGVAHALMLMLKALEGAKAGEKVLVASFGQGSDAVIVEATEGFAKLPKRRGVAGSLKAGRPETTYQRFLAFNDLTPLDRGMRAEVDKATPLSSLYRNKDMLTSLMGGKCTKCGTLQFPKTKICVNPNCNAFHTQEPHPFAEMQGDVMSYTADMLTYSPDPPQHFGMVKFAEGGRMMMDFTDVDTGKVAVGQKMRMVFRIKDYDDKRKFTRYFWKAAPAQ
jgi:3-hydroxy-3-methylglutaryl CoA synthase